MPIKKYANARPLGRDNTSDYSVNSDYSVTQAADLISTTLTKMSPAYKKGKEPRQADPL